MARPLLSHHSDYTSFSSLPLDEKITFMKQYLNEKDGPRWYHTNSFLKIKEIDFFDFTICDFINHWNHLVLKPEERDNDLFVCKSKVGDGYILCYSSTGGRFPGFSYQPIEIGEDNIDNVLRLMLEAGICDVNEVKLS